MTTPERVRRRERGIIAGLFLILALFLASSVQDQREDDHRDRVEKAQAQRAAAEEKAQDTRFQKCITDQITALTDSLQVRGSLSESDFKIIQQVINRIARAKTGADVQSALTAYRIDASANAETRDRTNIPSFPNGLCD